jgi:sulfite exporter TauE/SafE
LSIGARLWFDRRGMSPYFLVFLGGVAGSLHCVGMCGGFPLALSGGARRANLWRQLLYNLGRLNTLVFIGMLSGAAGAAFVAAGPVRGFERALAIIAGAFMILVGLEVLGILAHFTARGAALAQATVGRLLVGVMRSRSPLAPLALGVFNAFLPCQLIYAFAARAASTASMVDGMLTMLFFGLGTFPAMLALGLTGLLARPGVRARLSLASGLLVVALGVVTLLRGLDVLPHFGHVH